MRGHSHLVLILTFPIKHNIGFGEEFHSLLLSYHRNVYLHLDDDFFLMAFQILVMVFQFFIFDFRMSGIVIFKSLIDIFENELRFFNFAGHN